MLGRLFCLKLNISSLKKKQLLVTFKPGTVAVPGVFVNSSLSVHKKMDFTMNHGTTSSKDESCEQSYSRGNILASRKGKNVNYKNYNSAAEN